MREDMAKVIVERPRRGSSMRGPGKGYRRKQQRLGPDEQPRREGMKRIYGYDTKELNEHLGPLRRFLESKVGHLWDRVFAEICARINRNSAVQDHVRDHVFDFVEVHVVLIDGVPCHAEGRWYGEPLRSWRRFGSFYVCPKTGILKRVKVPKPKPKAPEPKPVPVGGDRFCRKIDDAWYLLTVERFPAVPGFVSRFSPDPRQFDVAEGRRLDRDEAIRLYGKPVYAVAKRLLGKRELRQLPVPIDLLR